MRLHTTLHRLTLTALLLTTAVLAFAPAAQADPWRHARHGGGRWGWGGPRVVYRERIYDHGGAGPAFAGLLGGILIGSALSHPHPVVVYEHNYAPPQPAPPAYRYEQDYAPPPSPAYRSKDDYTPPPPPSPAYRYEDGNGERWWDTLDECTQAAYDNHGPRVIHVVDARNDQVVRTLYWKHDHWISDDDNWDGR